MFTPNSPVDIHFITFASPIIKDIQDQRMIAWVDELTIDGYRLGTLRGYITDGGDDIRQARVRVTLDNGFEHEILLVHLMHASFNHGYARR